MLQVKTSGTWGLRVSDVPAALLVFAALGWSYAPSFTWLVQQWDHDPNHSYGYFVIPIALAIFWDRRRLLDRRLLTTQWWWGIPLLALLALRCLLYERNEQYIETATIPLVLAAVALAL